MAYLCWADNDGVVPPRNSIDYVSALKNKGVSVHTKNFPTGGHGYGFNTSYEYHDEMIEDLKEWMLGIDGILTSIDTPIDTETKAEVYYDLFGRRVSEPKHGIYIMKGRKIFFK